VIDHKTDTGNMKISSPELTALDLLRYARIAGTIDSVATILSEPWCQAPPRGPRQT